MKKSKYYMNAGSASIILLIAVIAMSVFAVLSIRASYHELEFAKRNTEAVQDYYRADAKAEKAVNTVKKIWTDLPEDQREAKELYGCLTDSEAKWSVEGKYLVCNFEVDYSKILEIKLLPGPGECSVVSRRLICEENGLFLGEELEVWDGKIE